MRIKFHPNAFKHGLSRDDIEQACRNAFAWKERDGSKYGTELLVVGADQKGRLIEVLLVDKKNVLYAYHAMTPPTDRTLKELGLDKYVKIRRY